LGKLVKVEELEVAKASHSMQAMAPKIAGFNGGDNGAFFVSRKDPIRFDTS